MITVICGIPNAGKTTYSKQYNNVIHCDDYNNEYIFNKLKINTDICIEGLYDKINKRIALVKNCKQDTLKRCIWLDTSLDVCLEREKKYRNRSPGMVIQHYYLFEPPTYDEGWDEIYIIRDNKMFLKEVDKCQTEIFHK